MPLSYNYIKLYTMINIQAETRKWGMTIWLNVESHALMGISLFKYYNDAPIRPTNQFNMY